MIDKGKMKDKKTAITAGEVIELPGPGFNNDVTVFNALKKRETIREISEKKLSLQEISSLLWAANGVNRGKGPFGIAGRTAASASNSQEIDLYVLMSEGVYLFDAFKHRLLPVISEDIRPLAIGKGQLKLGDNAPLRIVFIVDIRKLSHTSGYQEPGLQNPEVQKSYYFVDTGIIAGNIYLFAASQGLASWFHNCNKAGIEAKLKLRPEQKVLFGQTVGYPKGKKIKE